MRPGVTRQGIQYPGNGFVAFPPGYRDEKAVQDIDQLLMLVVDRLDIDAVFGQPLEKYFIVRHTHLH